MFQDFIEILILSAIQGISEFLPISSSAHLILISNFYDFKTSSLLIDISLHLGSLFAVMFYFKKDLFDLKNNKRLLGFFSKIFSVKAPRPGPISNIFLFLSVQLTYFYLSIFGINLIIQIHLFNLLKIDNGFMVLLITR